MKHRPLLLVTLGHPGSGKTHFSERLAMKDDMVHLSSDELRARMYDSPSYEPEEHRLVFATQDALAEKILKVGLSVICDANYNFVRHRTRMRRIAKRCHADCIVIWIQTHEDTALKRIANRLRYVVRGRKYLHRPLDVTIFKRLQEELEHPRKHERVIVIDGHKPFNVQYAQYKKQLRGILNKNV